MPRPPASLRNSPNRQNSPSPAPEPVETAPASPPPAQPEQPSLFDAVPETPEPDTTPAPRQGRSIRAIQPQLFNINSKGDIIQQPVVEIPALNSKSSLDVAFWWFRSHLEQLNRPKNTIASYMYDLAGFEEFVGQKILEKVVSSDVANFLAQSQKKSTRKRRLTSLGAFFKYLIQTEKVLDKDPTDNFYADFIPLKTPVVLDPAEQEAIMDAARHENSRTFLMIYFMLKLGFTRTELLAIQPEHVDATDPALPQVYVAYDDKRWAKKERKVPATAEFTPAFKSYIEEFQPGRKLFEMLPQSVNKLVERVARDAEINKKVTPQSLRDTYAVESARTGSNSSDLLKILGLAPDPRNRMSVDRYIKLAGGAPSSGEIKVTAKGKAV
ncbi:MAG: site-specific integrase [Chloroflexi bacterium]|nr:site-specific integrase [Chloroflexota bacterium]